MILFNLRFPSQVKIDFKEAMVFLWDQLSQLHPKCETILSEIVSPADDRLENLAIAIYKAENFGFRMFKEKSGEVVR